MMTRMGVCTQMGLGAFAVMAGVALSAGAGTLVGQPGYGVHGGPAVAAVEGAPPPARMAAENPVAMAERHVSMLARELGLEDAQTVRLRTIFADHFGAMRVIHQYRGAIGGDAHMAQMTALWRGTDARVAGVLTPEQKQRYLAIRTRQGPGPANMRPGGMGTRRGPPPR